MTTIVRRFAALTLAAAALAACSAGAGPTAAPSQAPSAAPTAAPSAAATQEALLITRAVDPGLACMDALMIGKLTRHAGTGLGVTNADGNQTPVEWPFGYSAYIENGKAVLVDEKGNAVAREGDEISIGGGLGNAIWHACGPVTVGGA